jgi:hypothetical protein
MTEFFVIIVLEAIWGLRLEASVPRQLQELTVRSGAVFWEYREEELLFHNRHQIDESFQGEACPCCGDY